MTQAEFVSILGPEWAVGSGRVDWFSYVSGKVSNEYVFEHLCAAWPPFSLVLHDALTLPMPRLSKPSRPARAYLHLMRKDYIMPLSEIVRNATWEDARATFTSPSLIGPPSLEFSIYKKVPGNKKRVDARQGTIDQDPEFMAFLEGLANPMPPKESIENEEVDDAAEAKVTTTPLIEYLKEKRANKSKETTASKSAKHSGRETTATKGKATSKEEDGSKKKSKDSKSSKSDKPATKEPVKILTKKAAAAELAAETAKPAANAGGNAAEAPTPKSRRAGVSIAARMLQRDLGLSPGSAYRRAQQDAAKAEAGSKSAANKENKEPSSAANESQFSAAPASAETASNASTKAQQPTRNAAKTQQPARKTRGGKNADKAKPSEPAGGQTATTTTPVILKKKSGANGDAETSKSAAETTSAAQQSNSSKSATNAANGPKGSSIKASGSQKKPAAAASSSSNATRGFIKHANSSQGITEPVLKQALEAFGTITFIEVDKRKGFAYVDFADHAGLAKAISASPIAVAQGTVQVLERKEKKPAPASSGSANNAAAAAAATPAAADDDDTASNPSGTTSNKTRSTRGKRGRGGKPPSAGVAAAAAAAAAAKGKQPASANGTAIAATGGG